MHGRESMVTPMSAKRAPFGQAPSGRSLGFPEKSVIYALTQGVTLWYKEEVTWVDLGGVIHLLRVSFRFTPLDRAQDWRRRGECPRMVRQGCRA